MADGGCDTKPCSPASDVRNGAEVNTDPDVAQSTEQLEREDDHPLSLSTDGDDRTQSRISPDEDDAWPSTALFVSGNEGEGLLIKAVRDNDCNAVCQLVQSGCECNAVCGVREGSRCLVQIRRENFSKQLQMVGYTALHVAAIHSSLQTIKCLLSLGADINVRDKNERTALQLAVTVNRPSVVRFLLDAGAEVNTRSASGRSPLMEAVYNLSVDMTHMLVRAGAAVDLADIKGTSPLYAVIHVMAGIGTNQEAGQAIVRCLIEAGCQVDRTNPAGASALMLAAGMKNTPVIHMLVAAGADVNLSDRAGHTPLDFATDGQRNLVAVKTLMQYGAATTMTDRKGQTPLSKSLKYGSVALLRMLLSADAVPHSYDILTAPRIVQLRQYLPEFDTWLHEELFQPRSLRRLCREVVRNLMSPHNLPRVKDLGLPRTINTYILGDTD